MTDKLLLKVLIETLSELEANTEIVICSPSPQRAALALHNAIRTILPSSDLTQDELRAVRSLISFALADKRFFDWEMPTLTGLTVDQFEKVVEKLPSI